MNFLLITNRSVNNPSLRDIIVCELIKRGNSEFRTQSRSRAEKEKWEAMPSSVLQYKDDSDTIQWPKNQTSEKQEIIKAACVNFSRDQETSVV